MKTIILTTAIVLASFQSQSSNRSVYTQTMPAIQLQSAEFSFFRIHRQASDVSVNWGISNPLAVDYYLIERSYDGTYFEPLTEVEGTMNASYRYRDNTVLPGYIYYRVTAFMHSGARVSTAIEVVRIVSRK